MRTAAFVIMMLLSTALSTTMSRTVREAMMGTPRLRGSLMASHEAINGGINTEGLENEWATMKCLSKEFCKEKKVICSKICKEETNGVETQHLPEKCFFKCKKCIPTC